MKEGAVDSATSKDWVAGRREDPEQEAKRRDLCSFGQASNGFLLPYSHPEAGALPPSSLLQRGFHEGAALRS